MNSFSASSRGLDAVLPLVRADYERARILLRSLERYFGILRTLWVVTPRSELAWMRDHLGGHPNTRVLNEEVLVPELARDDRRKPSGWFIQQLIKLAIADQISTDFYLTLDADVICIKPVSYDDLVIEGRAVSNRRDDPPFEPEWYDWAERVLELPRSSHSHGVTPALLSRDGVRMLQRFLGDKETARSGDRPPRRRPGAWRRYLLDNLPWTEYTLYFSYLEATGKYEDFHFAGPGGKNTIYGNSFWLPQQDFAAWDPEDVFEQPGTFQFLVVQSNLVNVTTADVWEKVARFLGGPEEGLPSD